MTFDLTADTVRASLVIGEPTDDDWFDAAWTRVAPAGRGKPISVRSKVYRYVHIYAEVVNDVGAVEADSAYVRVLIGPDGDVTPPVGRPRLRVKVTDNPEMPELDCGIVQIYE